MQNAAQTFAIPLANGESLVISVEGGESGATRILLSASKSAVIARPFGAASVEVTTMNSLQQQVGSSAGAMPMLQDPVIQKSLSHPDVQAELLTRMSGALRSRTG